MKSKKNLFICMTPFQLYFATKIIEKKNIKDVLIFLIDLSHSEKNYYYLDKAKKITGCDILVYQEKNSKKLFKIISFLKYIFLNFFLKKFEGVYIASLHDKYIHLLFKFIGFDKIYGFDDGVANINKDGLYFNDVFIKSKIIKRMERHYTVFSGVENIIDVNRLEVFNVFDNSHGTGDVINKVAFFIGQPYVELFDNKNEEEVNKIICDLGVDFYFKHPRENNFFKGVEYVDTNEIFESFLENYIKENPNTQIELYSFFSTVMFNVSNFSNVRLIALVNEELYQKYSYLYDLMPEFNVEKLWMK